jgi:hypothetical protein
MAQRSPARVNGIASGATAPPEMMNFLPAVAQVLPLAIGSTAELAEKPDERRFLVIAPPVCI